MIHPAIYECDKCHARQDTHDQFWTVGIKAESFQHNSNEFVDKKFKMQVCRACLESFGIYVQIKPNEPPRPTPPTLEDLIVEIIENTVRR